jgi:hypothetical protein
VPCSPLKVSRRFGGTYRLQLQGRRINLGRNSVKEVARSVCLILRPWRPWSSSFRFFYQDSARVSVFSLAFYTPWLSQPPWMDYPNIIWRELRIIKLVNTQCSTASRYFPTPGFKYSLQHSVFKHPQHATEHPRTTESDRSSSCNIYVRRSVFFCTNFCYGMIAGPETQWHWTGIQVHSRNSVGADHHNSLFKKNKGGLWDRLAVCLPVRLCIHSNFWKNKKRFGILLCCLCVCLYPTNLFVLYVVRVLSKEYKRLVFKELLLCIFFFLIASGGGTTVSASYL